VRQAVDKIFMCIFAATGTIEAVQHLHAAQFFFSFNLVQDQIDRLNRIRDLVGEHNSKVASFSGSGGNRVGAQPINGQTDSNRSSAGETCGTGK
jgi:hypothetical protein